MSLDALHTFIAESRLNLDLLGREIAEIDGMVGDCVVDSNIEPDGISILLEKDGKELEIFFKLSEAAFSINSPSGFGVFSMVSVTRNAKENEYEPLLFINANPEILFPYLKWLLNGE